MTSESLKLGQIITEPQERDAIHIAVIPVVAGTELHPGSKVWVVAGVATQQLLLDGIVDGVVDPYLKKPVERDQRFWLFLLPGTITSLRHEWTHPAFPTEARVIGGSRVESEAWLRQKMDEYHGNYGDLLSAVEDYQGSAWGFKFGSESGSDWANGDGRAELVHHLEIVLGHRIDLAGTYFSCSC